MVLEVIRAGNKRYGSASSDTTPQKTVDPLDFDLESFLWGGLGGTVVAVAVGGTVLYFTWPYIAAASRSITFLDVVNKKVKSLF